jgi:penicillin G amidase
VVSLIAQIYNLQLLYKIVFVFYTLNNCLLMRIVPFLISAAIAGGLITVLNTKLVLPAPLGKLLAPQTGIWQNAEDAGGYEQLTFSSSQIKGKANVYFDDRMVPHIFADNDEDAYFIQGFLHAKFRLFQIDLQTRAAEGRASEFAGARAINYDREQRRLGMRWAAEKALAEVEKDPIQKAAFDAYTNGINAYLEKLTPKDYPIEYKLIGVAPEKWTNLRTTVLLKMMAKMLAGGTENDIFNTNNKANLLPDVLKNLYPEVPDSLQPIIPKGTVFDKPAITPKKPITADSAYFNAKNTFNVNLIDKQHPGNGSNNWVVAGSKTQTGKPILCNDPHLELSLPSIWYELQIKTPTQNVYGVSLPGSPYVIIGFNEDIAWGVTNAQRDVKDYYQIKFKDDSKKEYWFNNAWRPTELRTEAIQVLGGTTTYDTVAYTVFGPVMYDKTFIGEGTDSTYSTPIAVRWMAHDSSNEAGTFYKLNRSKSYTDYVAAISTFLCPAQNFVFASKTGDIALWQQGKFPARWEQQGLFVMPGTDSSYMWQGYIPQTENPHALNPQRGYLFSANQRPVDATYPYFIPGQYITQRGIAINKYLSTMQNITPQDMVALQGNVYNINAQYLLPVLLKNIDVSKINGNAKMYFEALSKWNYMATASSTEQSIFKYFLNNLRRQLWQDDVGSNIPFGDLPYVQTTVEMLLKDSTTNAQYIDDKNTPYKETLTDLCTNAFIKTEQDLAKFTNTQNGLQWSNVNKRGVYHLLKDLAPFGKTNLQVGGDGDIINAVNGSHGPSWRMVVSLTTPIEAYGIYPGGQSGNPGSKFYDNSIDNWAATKPYKLWVMTDTETKSEKIKTTWSFTK